MSTLGSIDIDDESREWREARTLFGGYLHEDFDAVHGGGPEAVRAYARESSPADRAECARNLRWLASIERDDDVERAVSQLGSAYYPPGDGYGSYRVWLTAVADFLDDPEAHSGPPERDARTPG